MAALILKFLLLATLFLGSAPAHGTSDDEIQIPPRSEWTFFDAEIYLPLAYKRGRPPGNTYADAKIAFGINSYYAAEEVGRFDLTEDQRFEFAKLTAREKGAVYSKLASKFRLSKEVHRFAAAFIAARHNTWANVLLDLDALDIHDPWRRFLLIRMALLRSSEQFKYLHRWGLNRVELLELFKSSTRSHGLTFMTYRSLIPDLTQAELTDLLFEVARSRYSYDLETSFEASWIPDLADRLRLAEVLASRGSYFMEHVTRFDLPGETVHRLLEINVGYEGSNPLRASAKLGLPDRTLLETYFKLQDRERLGTNDEGTEYYPLPPDPFAMIETLGGPDFDRPGSERPSLMVTQQYHFTPNGFELIYDSEAEKLFKDPEPDQVEDALMFSTLHPKLLPRQWVEVSFEVFHRRVIVSALLRQCYRLSTAQALFQPRDSLDIACSAVGLDCRPWKPWDYGHPGSWNFHLELLFLAQYMPVPLFRGLEVDARLYRPESVERFTRFIKTLRERLQWDSKQNESLEFDRWLRLRKRLKLATVGIHLENLDALQTEFEKRPSPPDYKKLISCPQALISDQPGRRNDDPIGN
jgi:hypothetical protein